VFLTVDAVVLGNRERDFKSSWIEEELNMQKPMEGFGTDLIMLKSGEERNEEAGEEEEEVRGLAGATLKTADMAMSWEKVR